ncbi:DNA repair protein rad5 [Rhodotorula toruloides]|uniref:DNA repair protein rad5 n=1 Tax=Rhodotorula toruloides TaxID=5286 RepID=A0A511KCY5_RHOTO|nr:DNA repair protein rad5 [Rhodotorula toruloides]
MDFSNGFEEDDNPVLAPCPWRSTAAPSRRTTAPSTAPAQQAGMLDLTDDSPPPEQRPSSAVTQSEAARRALDAYLDAKPVGAGTASGSLGGFGSYAGGSQGSFGGASQAAGPPQAGSSRGSPYGGHAGPSNGFARYAGQGTPATSQHTLSPSAAFTSSGGFVQQSRVVPSPSLGRIPVISSASSSRVPSAYLQPQSQNRRQPGPSAAAALSGGSGFSSAKLLHQTQVALDQAARSAQNGHALQYEAQVSCASSPVKGKAREDVLDLTADDQPSDEDDLVIDETPVCIGEVTTYALVLTPVNEIIPPPPPPPARPDGRAWTIDELDALNEQYRRAKERYTVPLPVHIFRDDRTYNGGAWREMLRLITPVKHEVFGFVDYKAADVLGPLLGNGYHGTGVTKGGNGKLFCEAFVDRRGETNPCLLKLRLLLFTRPFDVDKVADILENAHPPLWLQHPTTYIAAQHNNARYVNPHNPAPGVGGRGADAERRRQTLVSGMYGGSGLNATKVPKAVDVQKQQVEEVFLNLKSGTDLDEVTPPPIVSTPLYPHQKQALSFLLDREKLTDVPERDPPGQEPTVVSLWKRISDPYGRPTGWQNLVTDLHIAGARPPPQARGAILADDMGLGKTIVVISLVCSTLADAREWAKQPLEKDKLDPRFDETVKKSDMRGKAVAIGEFRSQLWGIAQEPAAEPAPTTKSATKKKQAKERREKKKEEAVQSRFQKLVCRSRATLIVCPLSTVQNWESQFEEHTAIVEVDDAGGKTLTVEDDSKPIKALKRKMRITEESDEDGTTSDSSMKSAPSAKAPKSPLRIYIYHGPGRCDDPIKLADHDVVITTFATLATEYSKQVRAEEEREDEEEAAAKRAAEEEDGIVEVYGFGPNGEILTRPPGAPPVEEEEETKPKKAKRKRKRVEGNGVSALQAVQWYRVVLDEAHIIKEHKTIQARAACELSTSRRICLTGTPLQNSLNDIFSLIRFIRLEPFTDRHVWNQYIGVLAQKGDELASERLKVIMRYLALRRTKDTKDSEGKPILSLPPVDHKQVLLNFSEAERAFYSSHHSRYKHDFEQLQETDSVMKNFCSILTELLKLRQICVHPALLQDSEDRAASAGEGEGNLVATIQAHGISKTRAIQLLALMRDAGSGDCLECGNTMPSFARANVEELGDEDDSKPGRKPAKKSRKAVVTQTASTSAATSEDDAASGSEDVPCVVTRCQHVFCAPCFKRFVAPGWPDVKSDVKALCRICQTEIQPALEAVGIGAREFQRALERSVDESPGVGGKGKKGKKTPSSRLFEHSTKTRALLADLLPFSQCNPFSANHDSSWSPEGKTPVTGFQPVQGEVVKSVVFSQWTTLLDRLGDALEAEHIQYDRLDGSMNREQRAAAMHAFKTDPRYEVLLVSLRAGGVGLNLTAGRRVYLMEPFWNPAVENQAVDRIYRLGQTKPVQTIRFIMDKSIEANMLKIQKRKMDLANMSVGRTLSKLELAKERQKELAMLLD